MKMEDFFGKDNKILCSLEAEEGAKRLMENIKSRALAMDILPNKYERFTGKLEEEDYITYCRFLESSNGRKVLSMLEEEDAGNFVEL